MTTTPVDREQTKEEQNLDFILYLVMIAIAYIAIILLVLLLPQTFAGYENPTVLENNSLFKSLTVSPSLIDIKLTDDTELFSKRVKIHVRDQIEHLQVALEGGEIFTNITKLHFAGPVNGERIEPDEEYFAYVTNSNRDFQVANHLPEGKYEGNLKITYMKGSSNKTETVAVPIDLTLD